MSTPKELGGAGSNPEQLFAAGYSASILNAMKFVAARDKLKIWPDVSVQGSVGIGPIPTGFGIGGRLEISLPGVPEEEARTLVERAHIVCPYSNTTRGNVDVSLQLV